MPTKRLSEAEVEHLSKNRSPRWKVEYHRGRRYMDRQAFKKAVETINSYIDKAYDMKHPEKELALTVRSEAVRLMLGKLKWARGAALKSKQPKLDRRRDPDEVTAIMLELLNANIPIPMDLDTNDERYARTMDELAAKQNLFQKTRADQELLQSTSQVLKQDCESKEIGKRVLKVSTEEFHS